MRFGHPSIIAAKKRQKVLCEVMFIERGKRAHDAEVEGDVAPVPRNQNVPRMHISMKKTIPEHLGKEDLDTRARELLHVYALLTQATHLRNRCSMHALHDHHFSRAIVPVNLGHEE